MASVPSTMKAMSIPTRTTYPNPPSPADMIFHRDFPTPIPSPTQLLIRIHAAAISPYELHWPNFFAPQPRIPCHDCAGVVLSAPPNSKFSPGDEVVSFLNWKNNGGLAEYAAVEEKYVCRLPKGVGFVEAASLPRAGMTVLQGVVKIKEAGWLGEGGLQGKRVFITGATGAVGRMGIRIFKNLVGETGWVGGVGGKGSEELTGENGGADFMVNYREEKEWWNVVEQGGKADLVFDCVGGETLEKCLEIVKDGGSVVIVASPPPKWETLNGWKRAEERGIKGMFFIVDEGGEGLEELVRLVENGVVKPAVSLVVDGLEDTVVKDGWTKSLKGGMSGTVVVKIL